MKNSTSKVFFLALALVVVSFTSQAGTKEKAVAKATEAVENGSPDDWMLLAKQADYLIRKDVALATAKEWIEQSISIKKDAYNMEVFGDYYAKNNLHKEAISYYLKSADMVKQGDPNANTMWLQDKIISSKGQL